MGFFSFLDRGIKISTIKRGSIKEYVISCPERKGKSSGLGPSMLNNILKEQSAIIHIDTSLSFIGNADARIALKKLKDRLTGLSVGFEYRLHKKQSTDGNPLSKLFLFNKGESVCENIVFILPMGFNDEESIETIFSLGCYIYCAFENIDPVSLVQRILNGHFQYDEAEDKYDIFKFIIYTSSMVQQASLKTAYLELDDVKKLCGNLC